MNFTVNTKTNGIYMHVYDFCEHYLAQKPDIYRRICSMAVIGSVFSYAEIQIILGTVFREKTLMH